MDNIRREQLRGIVQLSKEMLDKAEEREWDEVAALELRRKQLVMTCFRKPVPESVAPEVAVVIREILNLNQRVSELGKQCQTQLGIEIHTQNRGRAATSAYLSHIR